MRTITDALAPYNLGGGAYVERQFTPDCSMMDSNQAHWVIVYPTEAPNLYLCFTHYQEWRALAEHGALGREARLLTAT